MIYILFTCVLIFFVSQILSESFEKSTHNRIVAIFSFFLILILYILKKNEILPDLGAYFRLFDDSLQFSLSDIGKLQKYRWYYKFEFSWCLYTKILSMMSSSKMILVVVSGIVVLAGYLMFIEKYSKMIAFSIMFFLVAFFYNSCFVLRQNMAVALCLMSIEFVLKRRLLNFLSIVIIASLIHNSAIVFIPIYWLSQIKINRRSLMVYSLITIILRMLVYSLISYASWFSMYSIYVKQINEGSLEKVTNFVPSLISLVLLLFVLYFSDLKKMSGINLLCTHALLIACSLNIIFWGNLGDLTRLTLYFTAPLCVLLPNICASMSNRYMKLGFCMAIFSFFSLLCYRSLNYGFELNIF